MRKVILITGSTDGIGLATARMLVTQGHQVLLHGRNPEKLEKTRQSLSKLADAGHVEVYLSDLSQLSDVETLAQSVTDKHSKLDVLINNAGILKTAKARTADSLDVRFAVNTLAPYLLTQRLLPLMNASGRVINVASAGQAPVDLDALSGQNKPSDDFAAYCQSKLALIMWTRHLAQTLKDKGPAVIAVNPGSLLGTKMVKEGFNTAGNDIGIGADILVRASLTEEFATATGEYFDNDTERFSKPHRDALDVRKVKKVIAEIERILSAMQLNT